jgi:hypothetical protein
MSLAAVFSDKCIHVDADIRRGLLCFPPIGKPAKTFMGVLHG